MTILKDLSQEQLIAMVQQLQAKQGSNGIKVSAKGAVSVYGLQRWPVTLYGEQWATLFSRKDDILRFIEQHKGELAVKERD